MEKCICFSHIRKWYVLLGLCLLIPLTSMANQQLITLDIKEIPLKDAVNMIAKEVSMNVAYSKEFVDDSRIVSLKVERVSLTQADRKSVV